MNAQSNLTNAHIFMSIQDQTRFERRFLKISVFDRHLMSDDNKGLLCVVNRPAIPCVMRLGPESSAKLTVTPKAI